MTQYKHLVFTTHGIYRLWDKDRMDSIDLSQSKGSFVTSILTDKQKYEICDYAETELTNKQYKNMRDHYILPQGF